MLKYFKDTLTQITHQTIYETYTTDITTLKNTHTRKHTQSRNTKHTHEYKQNTHKLYLHNTHTRKQTQIKHTQIIYGFKNIVTFPKIFF